MEDGASRASTAWLALFTLALPLDAILLRVRSGGTLLVLTSETEEILSSKPNSPVLIASGASVTYTFLTPTGSSYLAQVLPEGVEPGPIHVQSTDGPVLTILPSTNRGNIPTGR